MSLSEFFTIYEDFFVTSPNENPTSVKVTFAYEYGGPWCLCSRVNSKHEMCMVKLCDWKEITLNEAKELKELNSLIWKYYKIDKQRQNMEKDFEN